MSTKESTLCVYENDMEEQFFKGKRPWSKIKDAVLGQYLPPYLSKVAKLRKQIILIDAFAGPARFEDGTAGSPLIICQAAEKHVKDQYLAFFVNRDTEHHVKLSNELKRFVDEKSVIPILGTAKDLLAKVLAILTNQSVFLYLDPFGLKGCEFSIIEPFLKRDKKYSTEIMINLSVPTIHRLATVQAVQAGRHDTPQIQGLHRRLTKVLGGDYWKEILWDNSSSPEEKAEEVMSQYRRRLLDHGLPFTGSCPVRESAGSRIKYYISFCSRHPDAIILMNDAMCTAYNDQMHKSSTSGTLFENTSWKDDRNVDQLSELVLQEIGIASQMSRNDLWMRIIQSHFMQYLASEYKRVIVKLVKNDLLSYVDVRGTGKLNDQSLLYLSNGDQTKP